MKFTGKDGSLRVYDLLGNYVEVHFRNLDFSGPIGRTKLEEILVLDNGNINDFGHYINGSDAILYDPMPLSFSCFSESVTGVQSYKNTIFQALTCRDAEDVDLGNWTGFGKSTKGSTMNDGALYNPKFDTTTSSLLTYTGSVDTVSTNTIDDVSLALGINEAADCVFRFPTRGVSTICTTNDAAGSYHMDDDVEAAGVQAGDAFEVYETIRTVDVQFKMLSLTGNSIVYKYNEVYFPANEIVIAESEDAINITATGGIYGTITRHSDWV